MYLVDRGYEVLERNFRTRYGEIDIVAADGDVLVVCEVKTRSGLGYGDPAEAVIAAKATRLRRLALRWLAAHSLTWRELRFDVVTVLRGQHDRPLVRHLRGAF